MIFVVLAIESRRSGRRAHSTWPVVTSNNTPARGGFLKRTCTGRAPNRSMPGGGAAPLGFGSSTRCFTAGGACTTAAAGGLSDVCPAASSQPAALEAAKSSASSARCRGLTRRRRRILPPCSGLFIRRLCERPDHPEPEQGEDQNSYDGQAARSILHHRTDRE